MDKARRAIPVLLGDMLEYARKAVDMAGGMGWEQFGADEKTQLATVHCLEIIGEAAAKLPRDFQDQHPAIPWAEIVGMRNRLIHDYFEVDMELCWRTVNLSLPLLIEQLREIVPSE
ncbi:MAG: DUF86 domain-containing protein [Desulfovibrio sp.]|nr:DUF86 domain-containing protein [Desulfovibrio sp.]MBI4961337.1 DUF86 domain-containing protein [Desulfovibrio sp.]